MKLATLNNGKRDGAPSMAVSRAYAMQTTITWFVNHEELL